MKTKVKKTHRSKEEMISFIEQWQSSGESKKSFCTRHGIANNVFHYWYNKLGKENKKELSGFVEVKPSSKGNTFVPIEIIFPSGAKVILSQHTDPSFIRSIVY